jgi:hypothetical protein
MNPHILGFISHIPKNLPRRYNHELGNHGLYFLCTKKSFSSAHHLTA